MYNLIFCNIDFIVLFLLFVFDEYVMCNRLISFAKKINFVSLVVSTIIIGSAIINTTATSAQKSQFNNSDIDQNNNSMGSNSTNTKLNSHEKQIVLTWLKVIEPKPDNSPVISISNKDFWNVFSPLLEILDNKTINNIG